jgi:hypothetical protein
MVRALIFTVLFCTAVSANDIYVSQTTETPAEKNPAFIENKLVSSEKELISPSTPTEYCSVISGCQ